MPRFNVDDYIDVQSRINRFWDENPDGSIATDIAAITQDHKSVVVLATVRKHRDGAIDATGIAQETAGGSGANLGSWVENCETSAIGRALANMGYATSAADRMSREEAEKANRTHESAPAPARQQAARTQDAPRPFPAASATNGEGRTDGQGKFLYALMKQCEQRLDMGKEDFQNELERIGYPRDDRQMTKDQASRAITWFKAMLGQEVKDDDPRPEGFDLPVYEIPF